MRSRHRKALKMFSGVFHRMEVKSHKSQESELCQKDQFNYNRPTDKYFKTM
ncbi:hypothetical protein [Calothrix anomala]|uniref:Uncharacterized protein n=1 Tax=Calothrix anomala FACHB-343 TaxID=2692894 RepID=A0ABR8B044_9CYAN|nr:hypothetical protein [Calothrix anomala]MBD2227289.1 hypothetical protein [Calothrix anomala FACHB-343]